MNLALSDDIRFLMLEDSPDDAELIRKALERAGFAIPIQVVDGREAYIQALDERRPDLILADHVVPRFRHEDALRLARERHPDVPFILMSGAVGEDGAVEAIKQGATDYVPKSNLNRLGPVVRRALQELHEKRERRRAVDALRLILDHSLDAVVTIDARSRITGWNLKAERLFGWPASEVVGRLLQDVLIPERLRDAHARGLERYLRNGETAILGRRVEMPALHRDGHEIPVELTVTPVVQEGRVWFSAFLRDLSESRRQSTRLAVEHSVARILAGATDAGRALSGILEAVGRGMDWPVVTYWKLDPGRRVLVYADAWISDPSFARFVDETRSMVLSPEDASPAGGATAEGLCGSVSFPVRDGDEILGMIVVRTRDRSAPDAELGEVLDAVGRQIGQFLKLRSNEEATREKGQQLRLITDALPSLIGYVDRDRRYVFVNRAYEEWLGRPSCEILGKRVEEVLGPDAYGTIRPWVDEALSGRRVTFEARLPYATGRRWVEATLVPDFTGDGAVAGFCSLVTDIRSRKRAEAQLERRVRERTAKLEEITRELDAFASSVAHDLRAPLRIMKSFSDLLLEDYSGQVLDAQGQEFARKIGRASQRMSVLVEDLLAYSRLSRQEVPIEAVALGDAVGRVLQDMSEEVRTAGAVVTVQAPLPAVRANGPVLSQVLANLLGNAMKFVAPGIAPRIVVRAEEDGAEAVRLWIEDNGIGIPEPHQERIFGVFERLSPQDRYPGTGLGLAIVRRAVDRMGGAVGVVSWPGQGSRFWVRLPRAPEM